MSGTGIISLALILINVLVSYKGLKDPYFFERNNFQVDRILVYKEYKRIFSSGFLHLGWAHLIFNMITLYAFAGSVSFFLGELNFLLIYFGSLLGGNLLSLFIHRNHGDYSSAGASGAVCGVVFASIALFPGMQIGFFLLPVSIPAWFYGLVYVLYTIWGVRARFGNSGHDAHLGGGLLGMLIALILRPSAISENLPTILLITIPCLFFIFMIITRPYVLLVGTGFRNEKRYYSIDHRYNAERADRQKQIDALLEKIHKKGIKSLTREEKDFLSQYSKTV